MAHRESLFAGAPDIVPPRLSKGMSVPALLDAMGRTCFEARNLYSAARLYQRMVAEGDVIWLGISGAGIAGGMGGMVVSLLEAGFIDVICSTGAQVYHDLHFAFGLPVKAFAQATTTTCPPRRHASTTSASVGRDPHGSDRSSASSWPRACTICLGHGPVSELNSDRSAGLWAREAPHQSAAYVNRRGALQHAHLWENSLANHSIAMNLVM